MEGLLQEKINNLCEIWVIEISLADKRTFDYVEICKELRYNFDAGVFGKLKLIWLERSGVMEESMGIGIISTNRGDFTFQSADDAMKFIQTAAQENNDIWISGEQPYPCIAVCVNGEYAAINFFQNDAGEMWLSYNDKNQKEVTFIAEGDEWKPDVDAIIALNDAFSCIREFLDTFKRPACIQWQEL